MWRKVLENQIKLFFPVEKVKPKSITAFPHVKTRRYTIYTFARRLTFANPFTSIFTTS